MLNYSVAELRFILNHKINPINYEVITGEIGKI